MVTSFSSDVRVVTGGDNPTKTLGLGGTASVLVDATVLRLLLVPAATTLLDRSTNWTSPRLNAVCS
ncbi:hypothetical protein [Streptomyces sp. NPDC055400]